ncbi:MAG: D-lyxose/D-mannose family sugar isomerase [Candidatus Raymondbacteria bacterium RifOxyC12_full_50_8]|uniref:D-lyxose ketol-isomerase n=1 Tax=Candidatus Raymondbacteria bacterium RIFOXYD12_FULL_49_13 TaxID=1817890 RepID=A0A1F7FFX8_UNCRA|nr:MAG: D-lyxose/D-mannose family sugar isomerase [Candidatus Raymondbacteria bacterium RIFOXYA2_FULL_49_16]OGJ94607.1 MAG: D-lyxose/D-mannose family sugar isomerase [Candidatus Raymondbacteria bacterium RifOxyB12_full_50_8]OGJ98877.1 MAG: D-lyxose/D-mannose family sugar isomerase [Candidatus Raymondbacteria bacterium RifOxyC12_full_50_8]OGK05372.1 MAG: D-lyxose/D-mannose family sugar isomerase [Candidatus Raymondbacteria bacterium RIFOXYD12_FULL_49_13]OGP42985.1 MAG: D-lyxose/D-mannose family 
MKRSEINNRLQAAKAFFRRMRVSLPPWAFWSLSDWKKAKDHCHEIIDAMLGWDMTDFGGKDFGRKGLLLFTMRNGNTKKGKKPYAEKIMVVDEMQETPMHFHRHKMEDIINRGGGNLVIELYNATSDERFSKKPVTVSIDGITRTIPAGGKVVLTPGESICLTQGLYHRFYGQKDRGRVLVGEVSTVNDDAKDNRFYKPVSRFPDIEEDCAPLHLLAADYAQFLK